MLQILKPVTPTAPTSWKRNPPTRAPTTPRTMSRTMPSPVLLMILLATKPEIRPRRIHAMIDIWCLPKTIWQRNRASPEPSLAGLPRNPLVGGPTLVRGAAALAGDLALPLRIHRRESSSACPEPLDRVDRTRTCPTVALSLRVAPAAPSFCRSAAPARHVQARRRGRIARCATCPGG